MSLTAVLQVVNFEDELKSFPLEQEILLESSVLLEDSLLKSKITLLREIPEAGLLNTAELYNYNIGYVKESFTTVPLLIRTFEENFKFYIECKPETPLHPNSNYILFIDKDLTEEYISISKLVSKGPSNLEISNLDNITTTNPISNTDNIILQVISDPFITPTANIVKFNLTVNDEFIRTFTVDAKSSSNYITVFGIRVKVLNTAYGLGEKFQIVVNGDSRSLPENYLLTLKTTLSSDIKPIDNILPSSKVTNEDILNFYKNSESIPGDPSSTVKIDFKDKGWSQKEIRIEYAGYNKFLLHLNLLSTEDLDLNGIQFRESPAYNKYDLESLGLYSESENCIMTTEILDEKTILFTLKEVL